MVIMTNSLWKNMGKAFLVGGIISMGASMLFSNRKKTESKNEDRHEKTHKKRFRRYI